MKMNPESYLANKLTVESPSYEEYLATSTRLSQPIFKKELDISGEYQDSIDGEVMLQLKYSLFTPPTSSTEEMTEAVQTTVEGTLSQAVIQYENAKGKKPVFIKIESFTLNYGENKIDLPLDDTVPTLIMATDPAWEANFYLPNGDYIFMFKDDIRSPLGIIELFHEYGHFLDFSSMPENKRLTTIETMIKFREYYHLKDRPKPNDAELATILKLERDAWAHSIKIIKPLLDKIVSRKDFDLVRKFSLSDYSEFIVDTRKVL